jgi:hypothetical protein
LFDLWVAVQTLVGGVGLAIFVDDEDDELLFVVGPLAMLAVAALTQPKLAINLLLFVVGNSGCREVPANDEDKTLAGGITAEEGVEELEEDELEDDELEDVRDAVSIVGISG